VTVLTNAEMSLLLNATQDTQTPAWAGMMTSAITTMAKLAEAYFVEKQKALGVVADGIVGPQTLEALGAHQTITPETPTTQVVDFRKLDVE
jgi:peptidoglycan hydrolase-like protein with peptidoglycan-binding domain